MEESTLGLTIKTGTSTGRQVTDEEALKSDLERCGSETHLDDYESMPISEFGKALMRGMGWKDGEALGGSRKGILEPIEVRAQPDMLGLGAVPKQKSPPKDGGRRKNAPKPGEVKDHREAEKERIRKEAQERLGVMDVGTKVAIIGGRHRGLVGEISYRYAHEIMVRLGVSGEEVTVDKKDLDTDLSKVKDIKTREEEAAEEREKEKRKQKDKEKDKYRHDDDRDGKRKDDRHRDRDRDRSRERDRDRGRDDDRRRDDRDRGRSDHDDRGNGSKSSNKPSWLHPHVRVRIVDKVMTCTCAFSSFFFHCVDFAFVCIFVCVCVCVYVCVCISVHVRVRVVDEVMSHVCWSVLAVVLKQCLQCVCVVCAHVCVCVYLHC
jgi:G patch domain/KOW motif-containing protein